MTFAMPSAAARRVFDRVLIVVGLTLPIATMINPVTQLHTERWATWGVPAIAGVIVGLIASYGFFQAESVDASSGRSKPARPASARGVLAAVFVFALSAIAVRQLVLVFGASAAGTEQSISALVVEVRESSRISNRCRTFARFRFEGGETEEICVDSRFRGPIVRGQLAEGDTATLSMRVNSIGSWVSAVRVAAARSPNNSLERTRDR